MPLTNLAISFDGKSDGRPTSGEREFFNYRAFSFDSRDNAEKFIAAANSFLNIPQNEIDKIEKFKSLKTSEYPVIVLPDRKRAIEAIEKIINKTSKNDALSNSENYDVYQSSSGDWVSIFADNISVSLARGQNFTLNLDVPENILNAEYNKLIENSSGNLPETFTVRGRFSSNLYNYSTNNFDILKTETPEQVQEMENAQSIETAEKISTQPETTAENPLKQTTFDVGTFTHTQNGKLFFSAKLTERVEREEYLQMNSFAKQHGGGYNRFARACW